MAVVFLKSQKKSVVISRAQASRGVRVEGLADSRTSVM